MIGSLKTVLSEGKENCFSFKSHVPLNILHRLQLWSLFRLTKANNNNNETNDNGTNIC